MDTSLSPIIHRQPGSSGPEPDQFSSPQILMKSTASLITAAALSLTAAAHAASVFDSNGNLWVNYVGDHPLGKTPWGIHLEAQVRRADFGGDWQQLLIRPGINYTLNPNVTFSAGYARVTTYPYGDYPAADDFPENRLWEQVAITQKGFGLEWTHRLRLEQRFIGELGPADRSGDRPVANWRYENRIRYLLRTSIPLSSDRRWYIPIWDEVFFNFGDNVSRNYFDQNRAFIGIGRKLSDSSRVEVGFMEQTLQRRGGHIWENNHTVAVWFLSKWPFD
jgi:hypothetical protein